jgi:hypothetical protein
MMHDDMTRACTRTTERRPRRPTLDCSLSVNVVMTIFPTTLSVFNRYGLDTYRGRALSVADAARAADVDAEALCDALHAVIAA